MFVKFPATLDILLTGGLDYLLYVRKTLKMVYYLFYCKFACRVLDVTVFTKRFLLVLLVISHDYISSLEV